MIGIQDIERAAARLQGQLLATPCVESRTLSDIVGNGMNAPTRNGIDVPKWRR